MSDYTQFLRALRREPGRPTLFEPYPSRAIATQLIWRRGEHLWATPTSRAATLIELYAYIKSDVAIINADIENINEILSCSHMLPSGMKFVIDSADAEALKIADCDDSVCALASSEHLLGSIFNKPLIYIAKHDIDIEAAIERGAAGAYIPRGVEELWEKYSSKIALLGGLGAEGINNSEPLDIHNRIRALHDMTNGAAYSIGSGFFDGDTVEYLGFISMLGIYQKLM